MQAAARKQKRKRLQGCSTKKRRDDGNDGTCTAAGVTTTGPSSTVPHAS